MRRYKEAPQIYRTDTRTGDEFMRLWCEHVGSISGAEKLAGFRPNHLHVLLSDPERKLSPDNALKLAIAADMPVEAVLFRWTPIKDLDFWKCLKRRK
jgi:hypothetical protein